MVEIGKYISHKIYALNRNYDYWVGKKKLYSKIKDIKTTQMRYIYWFCAPTHPNLGDQAQAYCILEWFKDNYPDFSIFPIPTRMATKESLDILERKITSEDKIFIHSGYLLFDTHPELNFLCDVVKRFRYHKIVIFPQTINLNKVEVRSFVANIFNKHENLILMCRDEVSYKNAQELFTCKLLLFPDFVTSLIGNLTFDYHNERNGVLFVLRDDKEKFYPDNELEKLIRYFKAYKTARIDTSIQESPHIWKKKRRRIILDYLNYFSKFKVVITDRYHGTIFSQIVSTPTIVISSNDHKLKSGVKWFPSEIFGNYIFYAKDLAEAQRLAIEILQKKNLPFNTTKYFGDEYWNKLISLIG